METGVLDSVAQRVETSAEDSKRVYVLGYSKMICLSLLQAPM